VIRVAFGELLSRDVEEWTRDDGRGVVIFILKDETVGSIQPPVYLSAADLRSHPPIPNGTIMTELDRVVAQYRPTREYVIMLISVTGDYEGVYAWWIEPLPSLPGAFELLTLDRN
jgi:hypothetical protein